MRTRCFPLTTMIFKGPRFEDHRLDVAVLPEVIAYQKLLAETARELWRGRNPGRERLPKGFEDRLVLKIAALMPGSVAVALEREVALEGDAADSMHTNELTEAAGLVDQAIAAAEADALPPARLPARVIPLLADLGRTLGDDETLELQAAGSPKAVRSNGVVRQRIASWHERTYADSVDLLGEVTSADVEACSFTLRLEDGTKVPGRFSAEQEQEVTDALRGHRTLRLRMTGRAEFLHRDASIKRFLAVDQIAARPADSVDYDAGERPVWDIIDDLIAEVPAAEFERLPTDGAQNHDRYVYHGGRTGA